MLRRILTILAILASIGVIVVTHLKVREHVQGIITEREDWKDKHGKEVTSRKRAETELGSTKSTLAQVRNERDTLTKQRDAARQERDDANTARAATETKLQKAMEAEKAAGQLLERWRLTRMTPEEAIAYREESRKAKTTISVLEEEKKILNRAVIRLQTELEKINTPEDEYVVKMPPLRGKIKVVDHKWEFVVLDIGEKDGVLKDGIMMVHRNGKLIGKVKITSVMPDRSIANILPGWKLSDIQESDQVLF
jgi:hypothetical protein